MAAKFRLESEGGITRVWDLSTGKELQDVVRVEFKHDADDGPNPQLLVTIRDFETQVKAGLSREVTKLNDQVKHYQSLEGNPTRAVKFREFT